LRQAVLSAGIVQVDLIVAIAGAEELLDNLTPGDVRWLVEEVLDVCVEVMQTPLGDGIGNVVDGSWHVWQSALLRARITCLGREFGEEGDLEVVEILVIP
jgi:hypothetical protein